MSLLDSRIVHKPWGRADLPPPFVNPGAEAVGEIWFVPPKELDALLVKYIFTQEALSVQCHPSDAQTLAMGAGRQGKEECWLVLDAKPDARLAIGFREPVDALAMRQAALDGSIKELLAWHPVQAGDFFYIPANTVHAIGAGVTLIEVQQNSDITYRLYDYGRPRDLHLDAAVAVASGVPYPKDLHRQIPPVGTLALVEGPHFRLDLLDGPPGADITARYNGPLLLITLSDAVGLGDTLVLPGQCAHVGDLSQVTLAKGVRCLIAQPVGQAAE